MPADFARQLHKWVEQVCPINGVSIGNEADSGTWQISFAPEANQGQRTAAQARLGNFSYTPSTATTTEKLEAFLAENPDVALIVCP